MRLNLPTASAVAVSTGMVCALMLSSIHADTADVLVAQDKQWHVQNKSAASHSAELNNVRALPYGFHAVCEQLILKIRSSSSATFIVRDSALCRLSATKLPVGERDSFTLCSNDPSQSATTKNRVVPKCSDLDLQLLEI